MWSLSGAAVLAAHGQNHRVFDKRDITWHMQWPLSSSWANNTPFAGSYLPVWVRVDGLRILRRALLGVLLMLLGWINNLEGAPHAFVDTVFVRPHCNRNVRLCV